MKTIIVTGDSRGLGNSIAYELLKNNFQVIGISRTTTEQVNKLKLNFKDKYLHIDYDLEDVEGIKKLYLDQIRKITNKNGIYGLVNNAAFAYDDIITNLNIEKLEKMFKINVMSPMMFTKYTLRDMLLHKTKGSIIHISSVSSHTGYKGLSMYASTKGALESFSKNTAREWGELGIRSNIVCPGFMETDMSSSLTNDQKKRIFYRNSLKKPVLVESVANTVVFLLSENSNGITGEVIHVDNGTI